MDDIDRELKQVQLQRERLALARELARSQKGKPLHAAGAALASGKTALFATISRFVAKWGKSIVGAALLTATLVGGLMFREYYLDTKLAMAQTRYQAERFEFVNGRCSSEKCVGPALGFQDEIACSKLNFERPYCENEAQRVFFGLRGAEPSR